MDILPPLEADDRMFSALSYPFWFITSWWVYFTPKRNEPFVMFHVYQAFYLGVFFMAGFISSLFFLLAFLKLGLFKTAFVFFFAAIFLFYFLFAAVFNFFCSTRALNGEMFEIFLFKAATRKRLKKRFSL